MQNRGLLFIPDISGFTRFVNETEIDHSRLIIQELLEILINANQLKLEISEIEGDAILFYKFGDAPDLNALYAQVKDMFCAFHRSLVAYDHRRFCYCKACNSAIQLSLKVITHYGEFTEYNVKQFSKLIGKDIIVAHQLLKNEIEQHEYWLVTNSLLEDRKMPELPAPGPWNSSAKKTETGEIEFLYTQLTPLKNDIKVEPFPAPDFSEKIKVFQLSKTYQVEIITLFHAAGDYNYRHKWREGVKAVEEVSHYLPRVGMKCRCIMENGESVMYASSYSYSPELISFSETEEVSKNTTCYKLEKIGDNETNLTAEFYTPKNFANQVLFNLFKKKKLENNFNRSLENLTSFAKELKLP
jgi:hypothetical protein